MRSIRMLRAMRRELKTELRTLLLGHEGRNPGHGQGDAYGFTRQLSTLPRSSSRGYALSKLQSAVVSGHGEG